MSIYILNQFSKSRNIRISFHIFIYFLLSLKLHKVYLKFDKAHLFSQPNFFVIRILKTALISLNILMCPVARLCASFFSWFLRMCKYACGRIIHEWCKYTHSHSTPHSSSSRKYIGVVLCSCCCCYCERTLKILTRILNCEW